MHEDLNNHSLYLSSSHDGALPHELQVLLRHRASPCLVRFLRDVSTGPNLAFPLSYQVALFQLHEFLRTHILVHVVVVGKYALAIHSALCTTSASPTDNLQRHHRDGRIHTSAEHFPTAAANLSIGLVRPGILMCVDAGVSMRSQTNGRCKERIDVLAQQRSGESTASNGGGWLRGCPNKARSPL